MPSWLNDAVFYEIYPQSFQDSNADGIGDFQGIIKRLDYIKELGCNAIWMNPCFESPFSDAGYDVVDYYKAAPRYGTNEDLKEIFEEVHKRNMHLILDLVPGHTSVEHAWFKESMKVEENPYSSRYIWSNSIWEDFNGVENLTGSLRGISDRDGCCAINFFSTQPALNYGFAHPNKEWQTGPDSPEATATRLAMQDIMSFWMKMGCDGFRIDMAGSLVKGDADGTETIRLWQKVRTFLDSSFPEAAMISEWGQPDRSLKGGFHMDFLLHFGPSHYMDLFRVDEPYFSRRGKGDAAAFVEKYMESYNLTNQKGLICIPSGNHDMERMRRWLDEEEMKLAFAFLLSMPGAPFIYYGDEIGMRYLEGLRSVEGGFNRTGARTPMQWDDGVNDGFSSAPKEDMYIVMDADEDRPTVKKQMADPDSLYCEIKNQIKVRQSHPALINKGSIEFLYAKEQAYPLIYKRESEGERILVVLNPSGEDVRCTVDGISGMEVDKTPVYRYGGEVTVNGIEVAVAAGTVAYLRLK